MELVSISSGIKEVTSIPNLLAKAETSLSVVSSLGGNFSFNALFSSVKVFDTAFRAVGASIGMAVGSLIPVPYVGTIIGGLVGTIVADKILSMFKGPSIDAVDERLANSSLSTLASDSLITASDNEELSGVDENGKPVTVDYCNVQMEKHYADFVRYNKSEELDLAVESLLSYRQWKASKEKLVTSARKN